MKSSTFVYCNISCTKFYQTNLKYQYEAGRYLYQYDSCHAFKVDEYIEQNHLPRQQLTTTTEAFTNIKQGSNLFEKLQQDYKYLKYFKTDTLNLEEYLFKVKDLIIGRDLTFSTQYHKQKILDYFSKLDDNLSSLNTGDNCFLMSLIYLIARIERPPTYPPIPSCSYRTYS